MIELVPATKEHIEAMYGETQGRTVRAIAAVEDGKVLGVGGIYQTAGNTVIFANLSDELRKRPRKLVEASRIVLRWIEGNAHAICDPQIKTAQNFLEHYGFQKMEGDLWHRPYRS